MRRILTSCLFVPLLIIGLIVVVIGLDRFLANTQRIRSEASVNYSVASLNDSKAGYVDALADLVRAVTQPIAEGIRAQNRQTDAQTSQVIEQTRGQRINNDRAEIGNRVILASVVLIILVALSLLSKLSASHPYAGLAAAEREQQRRSK